MKCIDILLSLSLVINPINNCNNCRGWFRQKIKVCWERQAGRLWSISSSSGGVAGSGVATWVAGFIDPAAASRPWAQPAMNLWAEWQQRQAAKSTRQAQTPAGRFPVCCHFLPRTYLSLWDWMHPRTFPPGESTPVHSRKWGERKGKGGVWDKNSKMSTIIFRNRIRFLWNMKENVIFIFFIFSRV